MPFVMTRLPGSVSLALALALGPTMMAGAQTAQTTNKAPAKPATASGGKGANEKLLTRDELRVCLRRNDELLERRKQLKTEQERLNEERAALERDVQVLKAEREAIDKESEASAAAFKTRSDALSARIQDFNAREAKLAERSNPNPLDVRRIETDRQELMRASEALNVERDALSNRLQERAKSFNVRAGERDDKVAGWNERMKRSQASANQLDDDGDLWLRECGNRPYREDDEKAIRAGR